jgi:hypothetical protein
VFVKLGEEEGVHDAEMCVVFLVLLQVTFSRESGAHPQGYYRKISQFRKSGL